MTEINKEHENSINADINLLLRNEVFKIPDIYNKIIDEKLMKNKNK